MSRTGLLIALAVAAGVGLVFGFYPGLDVKIADVFFKGLPGDNGFVAQGQPTLIWLRENATYLITAIALVPAVALLLKLALPRRPLLISGRAIVLMIATLALAPGLATNVVLKDNWGRPRPVEVRQFGGDEPFVPWWDPRGPCDKNCSFVAGEPSGAFWTLSAAAVTPSPWRALAYGAAIAFGAGVGVLRMAAGAHFFTDVVFAGVFTFLIIWIVHGLLYRWRQTRVTDAAVERVIERIAMPGYLLIVRALARLGVVGRERAPRD